MVIIMARSMTRAQANVTLNCHYHSNSIVPFADVITYCNSEAIGRTTIRQSIQTSTFARLVDTFSLEYITREYWQVPGVVQITISLHSLTRNLLCFWFGSNLRQTVYWPMCFFIITFFNSFSLQMKYETFLFAN